MSINIKLVNEDCWESRKLSKCIPLKFYLIQLIRGRRSKVKRQNQHVSIIWDL